MCTLSSDGPNAPRYGRSCVLEDEIHELGQTDETAAQAEGGRTAQRNCTK